MIVDSSAIIAILNGEAESEEFKDKLLRSPQAKMSAATYVELGIVLEGRRDPVVSRQLDALIELFNIQIVPVDADQARIARDAYRDFGKESGAKAQLNFGDVFSYALASAQDAPLLFKGDDFVETDLRSA